MEIALPNLIRSDTMQTKEHILEFRVYLEDTDAQGIVECENEIRPAFPG